MKYKSIIFDCYGTLFLFGDMKKAWKDWFNAFYNFLNHSGCQIEPDYFRAEIDSFFSVPPPSAVENNFTPYEQRLYNKLTSINIDLSFEQISNLAQHTINAWHEEVNLDPETIPVLSKLNENYRVTLLSNFDHPSHIYNLLNKYEINKYFERIIISGEVGVEKPDPKIFSLALSQLQLNRNEVIYIGDSEEDYLGSRNAGIDFLLINRNNESTTKLSNDYKEDTTELEFDWTSNYTDSINRIKSLTEVLKILE